MGFLSFIRKTICGAILVLLLASPLAAQIEDHLKAYTGANATGYLDPLVSAIGTTLNDGLFYSAHIPKSGFHMSIEFPIMGTIFSDDDKWFMATTEGGFTPQQTVKAPTVVGPEEAVIIDGDANTKFAFPGGLNLNSFALTTPQLRIGSLYGTEALIRFFAIRIGDSDMGDIMFFGIGGRHSISQHFSPTFPVDLAANIFWQTLKLGENENGSDLSKTTAFTAGIHASKDIWRLLAPYTGLSYDTYTNEIKYQSEASGTAEDIDLTFDDSTIHWTIGLLFKASFFRAYGEYNIASRSSFAFGLGFGF